MFTGIIQAVGKVERVQERPVDRILEVSHPPLPLPLEVGDSIALDGVCQTVTARQPGRFTVQAIAETLRVTTLGQVRPGTRLNLETPLQPERPLGGHFVQGHVDGVATIVERRSWGDSIRVGFEADPSLVGQLVPKGSVAIDGISLTVGPEIGERRFEVFLIPHTLSATTLGDKKESDAVNLETDILGKYLLRYLQAIGAPTSGLSLDALHRAGFGEADEPHE
jgi:riboflavin synthase alpha subunit